MLLGSGCFWSKQYYLEQLAGVIATHTGFAGGHLPHPSYRDVCGKQSGHAEVVRVSFDCRWLPLEELLRYFFQLHDPTIDRRAKGGQYRSAIYFEGRQPVLLKCAQRLKTHLLDGGLNIHTEIKDEEIFYPAESRHQAYCRTKNIAPKLPQGLADSVWDGLK